MAGCWGRETGKSSSTAKGGGQRQEIGMLFARDEISQLARKEALLHDSTAARVGALFQLLVQDTTAQDFGLPSSAIRLRM